MTYYDNKIGLAFTGDSKTLKAFFLNYISKNNKKSSLLNLLKHEVIKGKDYYCFVEENLEWNAERESERRELCHAADEVALSFHFCYFNAESLQTSVEANQGTPYFDSDVYGLFTISATVGFRDKRYPKFKDWMSANFARSQLKSICCYGADCPRHLLDSFLLLALYEQYHSDIWEILDVACVEKGHKSVFETALTFRRANVHNDGELKMTLVWFAVEKIAADILAHESSEDVGKANYNIDKVV